MSNDKFSRYLTRVRRWQSRAPNVQNYNEKPLNGEEALKLHKKWCEGNPEWLAAWDKYKELNLHADMESVERLEQKLKKEIEDEQ